MAVSDMIRHLNVNPVYRTRFVHMETTEPEPARYGTLETPLSPALEAYLDQRGIRLYSHQCEAITHVRTGKNVILTTATTSGKTLAFNIPVFSHLEEHADARALYLYPTKALSNDQLLTLEQMARFTGISAKPALYAAVPEPAGGGPGAEHLRLHDDADGDRLAAGDPLREIGRASCRERV